jgi:hypothetical protein
VNWGVKSEGEGGHGYLYVEVEVLVYYVCMRIQYKCTVKSNDGRERRANVTVREGTSQKRMHDKKAAKSKNKDS